MRWRASQPIWTAIGRASPFRSLASVADEYLSVLGIASEAPT